MWIIDRYLLRQFLHTFLICFLSMTGLYVVFDAFTNLDSFLKAAERSGGLHRVLGNYYFYRSIWFFDRTAPLLTLSSAMFTVAWIQRHNELVALMAAGVSRVRVVVPVLAAVLVIIVLAAANRELLIPRFRNQMAQKPQDLSGDAAKEMSPQYDQQTGILIRGKSAFPSQLRIEAPSFRLPIALETYARQIEAKEAFYCPAEGDRPGGYLLCGVTQPKDAAERPSLMLDDRVAIVSPKDRPDWLQADQCFVPSDVTFEQLTNPQGWREFSSTAQLVAGLHNRSLDFGSNVRVAIHARIVQPLLDITLLLLGLPLVLTRSDRNVFAALGLCGALVTGFMVVVMTFQHLGSIHAISPTLAVWLPLMIFVPAAVEMTASMNR